MAEPVGKKNWEEWKKQDPGKKQNFQLRVNIIEARELQPRDSNGMSDPVCIVSALNKKQNTKTFKSTTICTWDHLMFFEFNSIADEFFLGKLQVGVFDANTVMRNVMIGGYEFDIGGLYNRDNHEMFRQWVALTDITGKEPGIQGYLKLSITVLGPGDIAPVHEESEEDDDEQDGADLQSMVLLPPTIQTEENSLEITLHKAEALPKMDKFGKCDGFVKIKYASKEVKTEVIKNSFSPAWNEKCIIPVTTPTMSDQIRVQVRDWDAVGSDDIVATFFMSYQEICNGTPINWKQPRWINLYGTPEEVDVDPFTKVGKLAKKMNDGYVDGNAFRGRVLVSAGNQRVAGGKLSKHKVNPTSDPPTTTYLLRFDLLEAAELQTKAKVTVEVSIGTHKSDSKKSKVDNGSASWYQVFDDISLSLPRDQDQIPDIFININKVSSALGKKKRIGYIRIKPSEVDNKAAPRWELITPDIFREDEDNIQIIGFILFKLQFGPETDLPKREPIQKPKLKKYVLRSHIYQGRELPASDANGVSDPYIVVRVGKYSVKTKIIKKTVFPLWYESLDMPIEIPEILDQAPDINTSVFDWDQMGDNDYLGRFSVRLSTVKKEFTPVPKWYPIYMKNPNNTEGEVLASFQLIPEEEVGSVPVQKITPKFTNCIVELSVVGLRTLLPYRLLPITKPYIEVDCGGDIVARTKISSKPTGSSPNFLEVIELDVDLPSSRLFSPPINVRVYDDRKIYKALIATKSISLAPFITWPDTLPEATEDLINLDEDEGKPQQISGIPGAPATEEVVKSEVKIVPLEEDHVDLAAMDEKERENYELREKLASNIDTSAPSRVKESKLPGFEDDTDDAPDDKKVERETLKSELELTLKEPTFGVYKIFRAKKKQGKSMKIEVGTFKGKIRVFEKEKQSEVDPPMDLTSIFREQPFVLRVYVLEGFQLVPKDRDGKNNPYVKIKCGKNKIKDVNNVKQATSRPQFFKCYEMNITFPKDSLLDVGVWDWDRIGSDDLIGSTKIDLENRIFSNEWKTMGMKPIEFRTLWNPSSTNPQGQVKLWVDIMTPEEAKNTPPEDITPPAPLQYELRVIVWETKNVAFKDKNMSDIFVVGYPEGNDIKPQSTDTHWRSENGEGKFNWRMKYPLIVPNSTPRFKVQVWDRDILKSNEAICEANLNLKSFYNKIYKNKTASESLSEQWIAMTHPAFEGTQGEILLSFEILSQEESLRKPAGFGRNEPNTNPILPPPDRPETSFNPFRLDKMIGKVMWGKNKGKIYAACAGCGVCIVLFLIIYLSIMF